MLGEHRAEVDGVLAARVGVVAGAHLVELAVDVLGRPALGALEHHVLQEVGDTRDRGALVARAGVHEVAGREALGILVQLTDDGEAVVQLNLLEGKFFHWNPSPLPRVTISGSGAGREPRYPLTSPNVSRATCSLASSSDRGAPRRSMSVVRALARAPLDSPCMTSCERLPVLERSSSASLTPSRSRLNSASITSIVSVAFSGVVPARPMTYPKPRTARAAAKTM